MNKIVCVVGMTGAGKSVLADCFTDQGWQFVRFGQITLDEVKRRKLTLNEANERKIRENIRKKHGMAAFAVLNYPKFQKLLKKGHVVADGLYSWAEYKYLKEKLGKQMTVVAVYAPPKTRYQRLAKRKLAKKDTDLRHRPFTPSEAEKRDYAELENLEKGGPIAMADYTLTNTKSKKEFIQKAVKLHKKIYGSS